MELQTILNAVCSITSISEKDILSRNKLKEIVLARHLYCYISVKKSNKTLKVIGSFIKRDHATVIHAYNKITNELEYYPEIVELVRKINIKLSGVDNKWLNYHLIYNNINISHTIC